MSGGMPDPASTIGRSVVRGVEEIGFAGMLFAESLYWTPAQQLAHLTVNGALARPGDLVASEPEWAAAVFAAAAATLRHLRTDPLLPETLVPAAWPSDRLRARYARYLKAIQRLVRHLSAT